MMEPRLMLLDEPSLGIAPIVVREIFELLATINRNDGVTILVAEQNASLALAVAGHAYVLETGRIAVSGTAAELRDDDAVRRSYLGY
jgi:branched-chain amino acid transport system ATP-binding protein